MKKLYVIYDDTIKPCYDIKNVIGEKHFGEVVYKRKTFFQRFVHTVEAYNNVKEIIKINDIEDIKSILEKTMGILEEIAVIHACAEFVITDEDKYKLILEKSVYAKEVTALVTERGIAGILFPDASSYMQFLNQILYFRDVCLAMEGLKYEELKTDALCNMDYLSDFLQYITGGFDARYFNSLAGDQYTVTKTSMNKKKIKCEYSYYHLLPDEMKRWFVLPYNYQETEKTASYTMERLHMTDIAIRWVHGAFSVGEFESLMEKVFYFVTTRKQKQIKPEDYKREAESLYIEKLAIRVDELKKHEQYPILASYIKNGTQYNSMDEIVEQYYGLYQSVEKELYKNKVAVIGHGDLCFSNMLYNKETETLKLIDVKGALKEEELWTNPYYDLAKLSHSVCGRYDFFNNDMYEIKMNQELQLELILDFDNRQYVEIFKKYLGKNGYDYRTVRVLEASLFLSMLPLHMDNPRKVFGFLLNAINILKEIKNV